MERFRLLDPEDIEVKVKQISQKGALALLYKTARVDQEILDTTLGAEWWMCDYREIKGNLYCTVKIYNKEIGQWIAKEDCGIESREDGEGNEKKGEASDAFKRACTKWGIGRELYSSPFIWLSVPTTQDKNGKWQLEDKFAKFAVSEIGYTNRKITKLVIVNQKTGQQVFKFGIDSKPPKKAAEQETAKKAPRKAEESATVTTTNKVPSFDWKGAYSAFMEKYKLTQIKFVEWRDRACEDPANNIEKVPSKDMTPEQWMTLLETLDRLAQGGYFNE